MVPSGGLLVLMGGPSRLVGDPQTKYYKGILTISCGLQYNKFMVIGMGDYCARRLDARRHTRMCFLQHARAERTHECPVGHSDMLVKGGGVKRSASQQC